METTCTRLIGVIAVVVLSVVNAADIRNENSFQGPYTVSVPGGGEQDIENWVKLQDAQISDTHVRLTPDEPHKTGAIWNHKPVMINDFEFHVDLRIHGQDAMGGNGMAIWYVRDRYLTGPVFGYSDYFSGLGVFIDTYVNPDTPHKHLHPYISAVVNNGSLPYSHGEEGTVFEVGSCHMDLRNLQFPARIAVSYITNTLTVYVDLGGQHQGWQICFKAEEIYLPTGYYLGVTGSTGQQSDNHDIIGISTLDLNLQGWEDKSYIIPHAEFVLLQPRHYEVHEEPAHEQIVAEDDDDESEEAASKPKEDTAAHHKEETAVKDDVVAEELAQPSASLLRKLVYIAGSVIILLIAVSVCRKYWAQRKERMHKRLY